MGRFQIRACLGTVLTCVSIFGCMQDREAAPLAVSLGARLKIDCQSAKASIRDIDGMPIAVVCRDDNDIANLRKLDNEVFANGQEQFAIEYRAVRPDIFVVIPIAPDSRCAVDFVPRMNNALGWDDSRWLGGFHSRCHGEVYDLAGRQLRPGPYSPTKFPKFTGNLVVPKYRFVSDTEIEFTNQKKDE